MSPEPDALKLTFQLTAHNGSLEVRASAPGGGETRAETALPPPALLDPLAVDEAVDIPASALEPVGRALYGCLMAGEVAELASGVLQAGTQSRRPIHFELRFDPDQTMLARYPWETIVDRFGRSLVRDGLVDLTRYITYPQPPPAFEPPFTRLPLLRVIARPAGMAPIVTFDLPEANVETLMHASFERLQEALLIERLAVWGMQFQGHGKYMEEGQCGALAFERRGSVDWIAVTELGSVLYNTSIQFALLLACETGRVDGRSVFGGLAPGLLLAGVPAVVGMQYPVSNAFANGFVNAFYRALPLENDLLDALRTARRMAVRGAWYSPVLYLRHKRPAKADDRIEPVYRTRDIDTAVPAEARAGVHFLVKLWIRRPETAPLPEERLRVELGVLDAVPIRVGEAETEVKFEPVEGRKLRRGAVEVRLFAPLCEVTPRSKTLFVDEHVDAPPAYFTVRSGGTGSVPLVFSVLQDGGEIASVVHHVQVVGRDAPVEEGIRTHSHAIRVSDGSRSLVNAGEGDIRESRQDWPLPELPAEPSPQPSAPAGCLSFLGQMVWVIAGILAFLLILGFG